MICGHDRETLRQVIIEVCFNDALGADTPLMRGVTSYQRARNDTIDTAKLAAIIAAPILTSGFVDLSEVEFAPSYECRVRAQGDIIAIAYRFVGAYKLGCKLLTMSQARTLALRLLDAATAQDIERMIGEL